MLGLDRDHTPGKRQLVPGPPACRQPEDVDRRAEAGDHAYRQAAVGTDNDAPRVQVDGHRTGRVADGIHTVPDHEIVTLELTLIVNMALGN